MKRKLLPSPLLSGVMFVTWLMLNGSVSVGNLLLGAALALAVPWVTGGPDARPLRVRSWSAAVRLGGVVLKDIVLSNIEVARRVLGPERVLRPAFVWVPLTLREPHGLVTLAGIITLTPGTLSAEFSADHRFLLVHVFNLDDEAALVADIQARYEAPLKEIFE